MTATRPRRSDLVKRHERCTDVRRMGNELRSQETGLLADEAQRRRQAGPDDFDGQQELWSLAHENVRVALEDAASQRVRVSLINYFPRKNSLS